MITQIINLAATVVAIPANNISEQVKVSNTNPNDIYIQDDNDAVISIASGTVASIIGSGVGSMVGAIAGSALGSPFGGGAGIGLGALVGSAIGYGLDQIPDPHLPPAKNPNHYYAMGSGTSLSSSSSSSNQHCTGAYNTYNCY